VSRPQPLGGACDIGAYEYTSGGYLPEFNRIPLNQDGDGVVDELRIYNRALSGIEIVSLYDQVTMHLSYFSVSNSISLSATQVLCNKRYRGEILSLDHPSYFFLRIGVTVRSQPSLSHRKLAVQPVPTCLSSRLLPRCLRIAIRPP